LLSFCLFASICLPSFTLFPYTTLFRSRASGVSAAGLRMSPASPPVHVTSTQRTPSAAYFAVVPDPFDASSSGCAWTWQRQSGSDIVLIQGIEGRSIQVGSSRAHHAVQFFRSRSRREEYIRDDRDRARGGGDPPVLRRDEGSR